MAVNTTQAKRQPQRTADSVTNPVVIRKLLTDGSTRRASRALHPGRVKSCKQSKVSKGESSNCAACGNSTCVPHPSNWPPLFRSSRAILPCSSGTVDSTTSRQPNGAGSQASHCDPAKAACSLVTCRKAHRIVRSLRRHHCLLASNLLAN